MEHSNLSSGQLSDKYKTQINVDDRIPVGRKRFSRRTLRDIEAVSSIKRSDSGFQYYQTNKSDSPASNASSSKSVQYQLKQVIGKGSYGVVYKAMNKKNEQVVAIKEVNYEDDDELNDIMSEIDLLKNLDHVNIVKYHGFIQKSANLYIILEYCSQGSLKNLISRNHGLKEAAASQYVAQTLQGLSYLHEQGVIHRDIKAANILLDETSTVKLADFGVSTKVNNTAMTLAGSLNWMPPEIIGNKGASTLSDVWSLGATVVELLTGNPPFHNLIDVNIYYAIENDIFYPPNFISQEAKDFINLCMKKNMYKRPTAQKLLQHQWVKASTSKEMENAISIASETSSIPYKNNDKVERLDKFVEKTEEPTWDDDFQENIVNISNTSPTKESLLHNANNDIKSMGLSIKDTDGNCSPSKRNMEDHIDSQYTNLDPDVIEDHHLLRLSQGYLVSNVNLLFSACHVENVCHVIIETLSNKHDLPSVFVNRFVQIIFDIMDYDSQFNDSKFKKLFITMGGLPHIIDNGEFIHKYFMNYLTVLYQCGVMNHLKKHVITRNNTYRNAEMIFELIYKYTHVTSLKSWYKWCKEYLDVDLLFSNINYKRAQSILIKVALANQQFGSENFRTELIKKIIHSNHKYKVQTLYVLFKSLSLLLKQHTNYMGEQRQTIYSYSSSNGSNISSPSASPSRSPISTWKSSMHANYGLSSARISPLFATDKELSEEFLEWLLGFTTSTSTDERIPPIQKFDDLHVCKYYIMVCCLVSYLNDEYSRKFLCCESLLGFLLKLTDSEKLVSSSLRKVIMSQVMLLMTVMSKELDSSSVVSPNFVNISLRLLKQKEFVTGSLDVLINILQVSLHGQMNAKKIQVGKETCIYLIPQKLTLKSGDLVALFYNVSYEDMNFGNFVSKYLKLISLQQVDFVCHDLIIHTDFENRIISSLRKYKNSLLIQIDILKLLKLAFLRALQYQESSKKSKLHTDGISDVQNQALLEEMHDMVVSKLASIVKFLNSNWTEENYKKFGQVGYDSVLINQLCFDLSNIL